MKQVKRITLTDLEAVENEMGITFYTVADRFKKNATGTVSVDKMELVIVAKEGTNSDWAAYAGVPYGTKQYDEYLALGVDLDNPVYVQSNGDKVYSSLAEKLFPEFVTAGLVYRQ